MKFENRPLDEQRLIWLAYNGADKYFEYDIHVGAQGYASSSGRDEPIDDDYLRAIRDALDTCLKSS